MADAAPSSKDKPARALRPRPAASLIVYEPLADGSVNILVGRRRADHVFLPGYYVFPGGRIDRQDRAAAARLENVDQLDAISFPGKDPDSRRAAAAYVLAALRETFEETGYMTGHDPREANTLDSLKPGQWREGAANHIEAALPKLAFVCRAITPPGRPRRFDTRFFALPKECLNGPHFAGDGELEDIAFKPLGSLWGLQLPSITRLVLSDFVAFIPELLNAAKTPKDGVPFYFQRGKTGQRVLLSRGIVLP